MISQMDDASFSLIYKIGDILRKHSVANLKNIRFYKNNPNKEKVTNHLLRELSENYRDIQLSSAHLNYSDIGEEFYKLHVLPLLTKRSHLPQWSLEDAKNQCIEAFRQQEARLSTISDNPLSLFLKKVSRTYILCCYGAYQEAGQCIVEGWGELHSDLFSEITKTYFDKQIERGEVVIESARKGHQATYGTDEVKLARRKKYQETIDKLHKEMPEKKHTALCKIAANIYGVSYKTISNHTKLK